MNCTVHVPTGFIDSQKDVDTVRQQKMMEIPKNVDIDGKDINLIIDL